MNLSIEAPNKEESKEYFIPPQSPDYSDDNGLENNKED
jgi:hypothetical protein